MKRPPHRAGVVALLGRPNVGKSTLINALVGQKISIVTPKPQTTRGRIQAIVTRPDAQLVLVDTPGLDAGRDALRRALRATATHAAHDADVALVLIDALGEPMVSDADREALAVASGRPVVVALNKIDQLEVKQALLPAMAELSAQPGVAAVVPISALRKDGLEPLLGELVARLPEGPSLFPDDAVTDQIERVICAELVREQLFMQLRQELPYSCAVVIETFEDGRGEHNDPSALCRLEGRIIVERESQKGMVVGKGGHQVKAVSEAARREIEKLLGCKVYLRMTVAVDAAWTRDEAAVRRLGYGLPG